MSTESLTIRRAASAGAAAARPTLALPLALFLASGVSGLIYQVLWQRMLALTFGVSAYATATVLAAFMAGLALGGLVAGRVADRVRYPLLWYGLVEVAIGLTGWATPTAFTALQELYRATGSTDGAVWPALLRFVMAFAVLLVPTALMGATFPLMVTSGLARRDDGGRAIGLLYAVNTLGAVLGALAAGFFLVGQLGVAASIGLAGALNILAGLLAVVVAGQTASGGQRSDRQTKPSRVAAGAAPASVGPRVAALLPPLLALSGFCSLAYEVVWTRLLILFLETTTYAFTVMLAAFLAGIALGSAAVTPFLRRARNGSLAFALLQVLVGATSLASLFAIAAIDPVLGAVGARGGSGDPTMAATASLAVLALFPPALFLGMSFPLAVTLYTASLDADRIGRRLGSLYAANVFGAIFGALAAGFLLVPVLGTRLTMLVLASLNVLAGLAVLAADRSTSARTRLSLAVATLAVVGALVPLASSAHGELLRRRFAGGERVLWSEEGLETTVTVTRDRDRHLAMYLNRHHQANDADWMVFFHRMLGHVPMLVHPAPREVLVVGLGGGATAGATTRYEGATVTVVELSRSVVRGADWFRDVNYAVGEQPNVRILVDDGRNHLLVSGRRYDVITADAIWPTHAGSTNLYSLEYYRLARAALADGGLMVQWVNRDLPDAQHKLLMRTFLQAFPHVSLWFDGSLLVGSERPIDLTPPWLEQKLAWPLTKAALQQVNIRDRDDVARLYAGGRADVESYVGDGPIITDDRPYLEYFLGLSSDSGPRRPR